MPKKNLKHDKKKSFNSKKNELKKNKHINIPKWLPFLILIVSSTVLYYQASDFAIVECDDHEILIRDFDRFSHIENWNNEFSKSYMYNSYYRPLVNISFMINNAISGKNPRSYHITNIIILTINACLVYLLLNLFGYNRLLALIGSLIYVVHPIFTNSVAWIVGRNDLIYSMFVLLSFIFLIIFFINKKWYYLLPHFLFFILALFSKETAIVAPILFIVYIISFQIQKSNKLIYILFLTLWMIAIGIWLLFRSTAELGMPVYESGIAVLLKNWATIPEFIAKFFLPVKLSVLPTFGLFNTISGLIIIGILIYYYFKHSNFKKKNFLFGAFWFLTIIIPGMYLSLLNSHIWNDYLECRSYLAMLGLIIIVFELIESYSTKNEKKFTAICIFILVILSIFTFIEAKNYKDPPSFYESAISDDSERASFHNILGQIYNNEMFALTKNPIYTTKAIREFKKAIELRPDFPLYMQSLAVVYMNRKEYIPAIKYLENALLLDTFNLEVYKALGVSHSNVGNNETAINYLKRALTKWQNDQNLIFNLADLYFKTFNIDKAFSLTKRSLSLDPSPKNEFEIYSLYNQWAGKYIHNKQFDIGAGILRQAVLISPNHYSSYENLMNYYLMIREDIDSASYFAKIVLKKGRQIDQSKLDIIKSNLQY